MNTEQIRDEFSDVAFPFLGTAVDPSAFAGASLCLRGSIATLESAVVLGSLVGVVFFVDGNKAATAVLSADSPADCDVLDLKGRIVGSLTVGSGIQRWIQSLSAGENQVGAVLDGSALVAPPGISSIDVAGTELGGYVCLSEDNGGLIRFVGGVETTETKVLDPRILIHAVGNRDFIARMWPLDKDEVFSVPSQEIPRSFFFSPPDPLDPASAGQTSVSIAVDSVDMPVVVSGGRTVPIPVSDTGNATINAGGAVPPPENSGGVTSTLRLENSSNSLRFYVTGRK